MQNFDVHYFYLVLLNKHGIDLEHKFNSTCTIFKNSNVALTILEIVNIKHKLNVPLMMIIT
jgi:hypothetical protein